MFTYPIGLNSNKAAEEKILITMTPTASFLAGINLTFASGTLTIDWKDGSSTENFVTGVELTHTYVIASTYIAEITGDLDNITKFIADNSRITFISGMQTGLLTDLRVSNNLYSGVLDLSLAPVSGIVFGHVNAGLTDVVFASSGNGTTTNLNFRNCDLTGTFDASNINVSGVVQFSTNPNLTGFTFASSGNGTVTDLDFNTCDITGNFSLAYVPVSTSVYLYKNSNLTGITFATSGNSVGVVQAYQCDLTGVLDLSNKPVSGGVRFETNSNLKGITFSTTGNGTATDFRASNCDLTGTLDMSNLPFDGATFLVYANPNLTSIVPASSGNGDIGTYRVRDNAISNINFTVYTSSDGCVIGMINNGFTFTEHDNQLINLDSTGWINGTLDIITGNTSRTPASDTAYNNLISNGWTIT